MTGIALKYARSVNSSSLADDEKHHNLDALAAVALSSELGTLLFRCKYADDKSSLRELISAWRAKVALKAKKRGWEHHARVVADESLLYWLDDICMACDGKGYPKIINAPTLEACVCQECNGTKKRPLQTPPALRDYVMDALETLAGLEREAGAAAMRKLSDQMRF